MSKIPTSSTGMLLDGCFLTEHTDSSAEKIHLKGVDVSSFDNNEGTVNYEHRGDEGNGRETVGKVLYCKKIYSLADCDTDRQRDYWKMGREVPFLYGVVRLFDGAGHAEAQALAAAIRDHVANGEPISLKWSIEGTTTRKEGNEIKACAARRVALTWKACNKAAVSGLLADPNAPPGFEKTFKSEKDLDPRFMPLGGALELTYDPRVDQQTQSITRLLSHAAAFKAVRKALSAGSYDAAPSTLTGGSALQREDLHGAAFATLRDYGWSKPYNRNKFKLFAKSKLPEVSPEFLDHFADVAEGLALKRALIKKERITKPKLPKKPGAMQHSLDRGIIEEIADADEQEPAIPTAKGTRKIASLTYRGKFTKPNVGMVRPSFDPKKGVLHTPAGSIRAYLPKHDGKEAAEHYQKLLSHPDIEKAMDTALTNWSHLHQLHKTGKVPPEVIMHAVMFSQLSPNKCLDAETEALTQRGWVKGFDLKKTDILLTKREDTGVLEWQPVQDLFFYPDYEGPLVEFKSKSFNAVSTPNHRWLVTTSRGHVRVKNSLEITNSQDQIHRTGDYKGPEHSALTPDEAEVLGWFVTDGHYVVSPNCSGARVGHSKYEIPGTYARINQSTIANPEKCARIEALLQKINNEVTAHTGKDGKRVWTLGPALTTLMLKYAPDRCLTMDVLIVLSRPALDRLREAMILGDGTRPLRKNKPKWNAKEALITGRRWQADAFQALCSMTGSSSYGYSKDYSKYQKDRKSYNSISNVPKLGVAHWVNVQRRTVTRLEAEHRHEFTAKTPVWCPSVANGFFVARRNGQVFVTGNSVPVQEIQYARLADAMDATGIDPRQPGFEAIEEPYFSLDRPDVPPHTAREEFKRNPAYYQGGKIGVEKDLFGNKIGDPSPETGRYPGELLSGRPLFYDFLDRARQYHKLHNGLVELINRNKGNGFDAVAEMMNSKRQAENWRNARRTAIAGGKPDPGEFQGMLIPGLKVKTGLYTMGMMGNGDSVVPDTHFVRNMYGLDLERDAPTIDYLKNLHWRPTNMESVMRPLNEWYLKNHPAVQYTLNHPKWGSVFERPQDALFPSFWRHWLTIQPHEAHLGLPNMSEQAGTTHAPYWETIRPFLEAPEDAMEKAVEEPDSSVALRTALVHQQYVKDFGEVPAMLLYYHHLVPKLLEAAERRRRTGNDMQFLAKARALEAELIDLRKDVQDALQGPPEPDVRGVYLRHGDHNHPAGRFLIHNNQVHHLEDYHGLLGAMLPEGPLNATAVSRLHGMQWSPNLGVVEHHMAPLPPPEAKVPETSQVTVAQVPVPHPAPVFEYHRPGLARPHVVEFSPQGAALDGKALSDAELALMLRNASTGLATIRYRKATGLAKAEGESEPDPETDFATLYARHPESREEIDRLRRHAFEDPMVGGIGNKFSYNTFRVKNKPGVYISGDANDFRDVNNIHGHDAGDAAITAMGRALRDAAAKTTGLKVWRPGGDEFVIHAPTYEHAARFLRNAREHLDSIPPVNGVHKLSMSFGLGNDFKTADKALYAAKEQKKDPLTGQRAFPSGKMPHFAHSLVAGAEGPLPMHDEAAPPQHVAPIKPAA